MKLSKNLFSLPVSCFSSFGCGLLEEEPEEEKKVDNTTYNYSYTCPTGKKYTIQIPNRLSATCKSNWEYDTRTYGCNDAGNFPETNKRKAQCP